LSYFYDMVRMLLSWCEFWGCDRRILIPVI